MVALNPDYHNQVDKDDSEDKNNGSVIIMDTAFSIVLLPEVSFNDAIMLGTFCSVKECMENSVSFELTRTSTVRGFDQGITSQTMLELLERLSGNRLDSNIGWTIKEWESRYAEVALHQGIVLSLADDRRYLAQAGPVSALIRKTLMPGVYLLSSTERAEAVRALQKAGVDIVAQPPVSESGKRNIGRTSSLRSIRTAFPKLESLSQSKLLHSSPPPKDLPSTDPCEAASIRENFRVVLEKMRLAKHERDELLARIERRIVLSEAQLEAKSLRYEKLEARGLDFAGKALIAKQAIDAGSLVEVSWPGSNGELNQIVGIPQSLEKKDGDSIFVFRTGETSENSTRVLQIPLRKISLLRRIKQSLFKE